MCFLLKRLVKINVSLKKSALIFFLMSGRTYYSYYLQYERAVAQVVKTKIPPILLFCTTNQTN